MTAGSAGLTLVLRDLAKRYGATRALAGLSLTARGGEILGVAGPNGAGKSTMVGVVAGEIRLDAGSMSLSGTDMTTAVAPRVAVVHQEPQVFDNLTVAENLLVGREHWTLGKGGPETAELALLDEFQLAEDVDTPLAELSLATKQRTEIIRALLLDADVFLFDEPNSALSDQESARMFYEMRRLADRGKVVILVSHRLGELARHCTRVAVIRDGTVRTELSGAELNAERIAREMVEGEVAAQVRSRGRPPATQTPVIEVTDWAHKDDRFTASSVRILGGTVTVVMGVEGSGAREFVRSLAGLEPCDGRYQVAGQVVYMTGERRNSLFSNLTVEENLAVRTGTRYARFGGWWDRPKVRKAAEKARTDFGIVVGDVSQPIRSLSGGNQQKVAIASALADQPAAVAVEEPTRGVDVGARHDIFRHLRDYAEAGRAVVMYCTEELEAFECGDVVLLMWQGRFVGQLTVADFDDVEVFAEEIARSIAAAAT